MAGREGVGPADPHRVLQVHPDACPEVIEAAFGVLREMILRSDADDAPARLAELMAAHRALTGAPGPQRWVPAERVREIMRTPAPEGVMDDLRGLEGELRDPFERWDPSDP